MIVVIACETVFMASQMYVTVKLPVCFTFERSLLAIFRIIKLKAFAQLQIQSYLS